MIKKEIVKEFKQYTPEEDLQNMIRYFAMHSIASSNTKTKDGSNDQH
jgi:hypothetical protein